MSSTVNTYQGFLLSPYRPPTSYPVTLSDGEAAAWLNAHAALWHPLCLHLLANPAAAASSYDHDQPRNLAIYAMPTGPTLYQPSNWNDQVADGNSLAFVATPSRQETIANLIAAAKDAKFTEQINPKFVECSAEIVRLFSAVGFGYLTLETWYDAASHEHLLDVNSFFADVKSAVDALPDVSEVRQHLSKACEKLYSARETIHYGQVRLFDVVLLEKQNRELAFPWAIPQHISPVNIVASAHLLEQIKANHADRWAEIIKASEQTEFCVGSQIERDDIALPIESQIWNLKTGRDNAERLTGQSVRVYGRCLPANHMQLPSMLKHTGYSYAFVSPLQNDQPMPFRGSCVQWPGADGCTIEAYAKEPLPVHDSQSFFNLAYHLYQAATNESNATIAFVKHEKAYAEEYFDLQMLCQLSTVCGDWHKLGQFLADVGIGDYSGVASPDDFPIDALDQSHIQAHIQSQNKQANNHVSQFVRHLKLRRRIDSAFGLSALHRSLSIPGEAEKAFDQALTRLEHEIEQTSISTATSTSNVETELAKLESAAATRLTDRLQARSESGKPGYMVLNPCGFTRRVALELPAFSGAVSVEGPIKAAQFDIDKTRLVVEVPSFGYAWIPRQGNAALPKAKIKSAEKTIVRNEFLEAEFDPVSGGIKAFRDLRTMMTRLGVIPVFHPGCKTRGTGIKINHSGSALGEIVSMGELVNEMNEPLAKFELTARAWVGRPVLELRCRWIEITHKPTGFPWHAYYGLRFGTRDERIASARGINGTSYLCNTGKLTSPDFFEFRFGRERTFVFTGGQAFMNRATPKTYDLIQITQGEAETTFDCLLSLDRDVPMQTAMSWTAPAPFVPTDKGPPAVGASSWLTHIDAPSLIITDIRPTTPSSTESNRAVSIRMIESSNYATTGELKFARDPGKLFRVNGNGETQTEIIMENDAVPIQCSAGELLAIRAEWK